MSWYDIAIRHDFGLVRMAQVGRLSLQEASDRGLFGPVWHGTSQDRLEAIREEGFKVFEGEAGSGDIRHGYQPGSTYSYDLPGVPPPVHHLGFGVYLTTSKTVAKQFAGGSGAGMRTYYIDAPRMETINFGSPRTMMKWWVSNGYDPKLARTDRLAATRLMTNNLKSKFDAVWFKGKGLRRLLDGDQVCVYDPTKIYEIDPTLSSAGESGAKVRRKTDGMRGTILSRRDAKGILEQFPLASSWLKPETKWIFKVKWQKGGTRDNVQDVDVEFL